MAITREACSGPVQTRQEIQLQKLAHQHRADVSRET
jgi:hypothetical protein